MNDKLERLVRRFILRVKKVLAGHRPSCGFVTDPTSTTDCFCRRWRTPNARSPALREKGVDHAETR